jgi:transcriptional regulator with XRE-family HTH domain
VRDLAKTAKLFGVDAEHEQALATIGPRLRALRQHRGMTLAELSAATGISVSGLSRLESGKRRPTLDLLLPLARAHRVALDQLVAAPATGDPRVHLTPLRHRQGSILVPLTRYPGRLQVFKQVIAPRPRELVAHAGYEWLFVLAGELLLVIGNRELTLRPGEVAEFDTAEPHWFGPSGRDPVEILHIFGPHGDKARVRARPAALPPHGAD